MKRFLTLAILVTGLSVASFAQANSGYMKSSPTHANTDTLTNAATVTQTIAIPGYNAVVTIQPVITRVTGTAAGVVRLFGSIDGTNYVRVNPTDSLLMTNVATQSKIFTISPSAYTHYRITVAGSGTQSSRVLTPVIWRKP
jgi:hypothetical protein